METSTLQVTKPLRDVVEGDIEQLKNNPVYRLSYIQYCFGELFRAALGNEERRISNSMSTNKNMTTFREKQFMKMLDAYYFYLQESHQYKLEAYLTKRKIELWGHPWTDNSIPPRAYKVECRKWFCIPVDSVVYIRHQMIESERKRYDVEFKDYKGEHQIICVNEVDLFRVKNYAKRLNSEKVYDFTRRSQKTN